MSRNGTQVVTNPVRLSFLNVFKPRTMGDGAEPKYTACLLIPKTDKETLKDIKDACEAARLASGAMFGGKVPERLKLPLHDGDGEMPNGGSYGDECKGMWVLNASSKQQPGIVDRRCNDILDQSELYSGCWGRVALNFFAYSTGGNKGIGAGLNHIQKIRDDEPMGGRTRAKDVFSVMEDEDDGLGL
jgi:hypothetical protein